MQCIKLFIGYVYEAKDFYMRLCIGIRCLELEYPKKTVITLCMMSSFIGVFIEMQDMCMAIGQGSSFTCFWILRFLF